MDTFTAAADPSLAMPGHGPAMAEGHTPAPAAVEQLARHRRWCNVRRLLLVRLDGMAGTLASSAAFAAVRETLPWAHLTLLASPAALALRPHLTVIDEFMGFNASWEEEGAAALEGESPAQRGDAEMHLARRLRRSHFDAAILFTGPSASALPAALICRMAGLPMVLAHAQSHAHGLLTEPLDDDPALAAAPGGGEADLQRQLALVAHVGLKTHDERPRFKVVPKDQNAMRQALRQAGLREGQGYVVVQPSCADDDRDGDRRLLDAARALEAERQWRDIAIVTCGDMPAREGLATLRIQPLSIGERAALFADARALVSDGGDAAMLAAAVGTPTVDVHRVNAHVPAKAIPWQMMTPAMSRALS